MISVRFAQKLLELHGLHIGISLVLCLLMLVMLWKQRSLSRRFDQFTSELRYSVLSSLADRSTRAAPEALDEPTGSRAIKMYRPFPQKREPTD